jgi:hypothetical protein
MVEYCVMPDEYDWASLKVSTPATYRIEVEGAASKSLLGYFGNVHITTRQRKDNSIVTILVGQMRDQAEFAGLINTLFDWHMPIRSVEIISIDK